MNSKFKYEIEKLPDETYQFSCAVFWISGLLFLSFMFVSCDQSFQPLKENDVSPFSMYGTLDASADTQWVRVTPLREQVETLSEKPEMNVTLENLESGTTAVMEDSLFQFFLPGGQNTVNVRTSMEVEFGQSYKLKAERPDGAASSVTVTIPEDFPTPRVIPRAFDGCLIRLEISGVKRLADVQYQMRVKITRPGLEFIRSVSVPYRSRIRQTAPDEYRVNINLIRARDMAMDELGALPANTKLKILERYLFIASGGPDWIDNEELGTIDDLVYALPEVASNVENGVGYVVGIVSKKIPDNVCPETF
ncbi:MAG: hypothetical protein WEA56_06835 [Balneolaceae bacterium]